MKQNKSYRVMLAVSLVVSQMIVGVSAQEVHTTQTPLTTQPTTAQRNSGGVTRQNGGMLLNFVDASIDIILDELSSAAGFIVVKEVKPEGRVTLVSKQPVSPAEAVSLLNTVLRNAGYAAIQQDRILKIVNKDVAKRLNIPVRSGNDPEKIAKTDELITQVIPLRFADATQLKTDLGPLISSEADFTANASANALVITDTSANIRRVVEIVAALDTNLGSAVDVKVFQLKFANATTAARLINEVFGNLDATRPQQNQGAGNNPGPGGGGDDGPGGRFRRFIEQAARNNQQNSRTGKVSAGADERTNSIIVTGPSDLLETVAGVIKELDSNPAAEETVYVYRLKNAQALNLEQVLNSLFNGTPITSRTSTSNADVLRNARSSSGSFSGSGRSGNTGTRSNTVTNSPFGTFGGMFGQNTGRTQTFGGNRGNTQNVSANAQAVASDLAGQVSIIADTDTNSLLIRTAPGNYPRVKSVLDEMDKPVRQVLIKVLIAEVTHTNGSDIGAELSALNIRASGNGQQAQTNFLIPGIQQNGTGLVVQLLETDFQATIRLLETQGKLDVLSRPYILASDNQLASITVGQEVPLIDSSRITDTGQTINTLSYQDVGILLDVIPSINPDGLVILDVAPEISTLTGETVPISDTASQPIIAKRSAQTRVGVRSGNTIVIGGLMEDRVTESVNKVPLLGDIPLLGEAFKRTVKNKAKTELLIFLTPHVADSPEQIPGMSKDEVDATKLLPKAIGPGVYDEHRQGMQRGDPAATTPSSDPGSGSQE
ncbi:MAG: hypothetical protein KatS3mg104_1938 [Phycisphaerae bacterium]|jgi:general secretion pathway protein D|nr:MAG: hypothetical protein KatS3mg104_1938 [Phycisphaerae bacterium]